MIIDSHALSYLSSIIETSDESSHSYEINPRYRHRRHLNVTLNKKKGNE